MSAPRYTCPCCGYVTLDEWPGSYSICPICFWEDDPVQLLDPWYEGGANKPSLKQAQISYSLNGAMELRFRQNVRAPTSNDQRDTLWRPVADSDAMRVRTPADLSDEEHKDLTVWYYWKSGEA